MITADLIIKDGTCVTHKKIFKADIAIKKGKILKIGILDKFKAKKTINAKGLHILPGAFDTQVHFREPGQEYKEDLNSGSRSAVAGGIQLYLICLTIIQVFRQENFLKKN